MQASLLGLPEELRLQIYQHVFALNLAYPVLQFWQRFPKLNPDARLVVPWINLMLSCKTLAIELRSFMSEKTFLNDDNNTTWFLELEARIGGRQLGRTTWQRLPCPPEKVRILETSYNAKSGFHAWVSHSVVGHIY